VQRAPKSLLGLLAVRKPRAGVISRMSKPPTLVAGLIAEFLGTFVLILFGPPACRHGRSCFPQNSGSHGSRRLHQYHSGWGWQVTMGIYVAG